MKTLPEKIEQALINDHVLHKKDKILIACSGGPDSVALFHLFRSLRTGWSFRLGLAYFNHGLRKQAARGDEFFVRNLGKDYRVSVYLGRGEVQKAAKQEKASLEEAGRKLRYEFLIRTAKRYGYSKVLLAHHQNDQAETVLMRMLQGTGISGLCGIRKVLQKDGVVFYRPLLAIKKIEILDYLKQQKLKFRKDASNQSIQFLRNKIRRQLIPYLETSFNPRVLDALCRIPDSVGEEVKALDFFQAQAWKGCFKKRKVSQIFLKAEKFFSFPPAIQFRILNQALRELDPQSGLSYDAWSRIRAGLGRKSGRRWSLPKNIDLSFTSNQLLLKR
ncbi:MAG: tRNA lysidine(34) synthetase TilS [Candidatus Omnitrophica bacterium]|nr:tRNA lysidine(34) synthetase TilS [Candidatus Omnitrophota bacterium]